MQLPSLLPAVVKPPRVIFLPLHSLGAVSSRPDQSGSFLWRWNPSCPTTFSPGGYKHPSPDSLGVCRREPEGLSEATPSLRRLLSRPGNGTGRLHQPQDRGGPQHRDTAYTSLRAAPSGNTPVSQKRPSAMSNLRATATIPIRRKRLPPLPQRSRNHTRRALSGCKRSQLHANSVVLQRTGRLPALVIPCSRALSPR